MTMVDGQVGQQEVDDFRVAVLDGLAQPQKQIPSKFLYDARGSVLFEEICTLEEYYVTRTESALLSQRCGDIAALAGPQVELVELGSGASTKVRMLLDALEEPAAYVAVDIAQDHLEESTQTLAADYPELTVVPLCADFTGDFSLPRHPEAQRRLGFFPGSTIGNFDPTDGVAFLGALRDRLGEDSHLIVGADLKKAPGVLHAAYNDSRGVTAAFNRNLLDRMNRQLGATFTSDAFDHEARYVEDVGRIEMHLVSRIRQTVSVAGEMFAFEPGESIHTENSYKYTLSGFQDLGRRAGWSPVHAWTDDDDLFSIHYLCTD